MNKHHYPYFTGWLRMRRSRLCRHLQPPLAEAFWAVGAPGCARLGSGPAEPKEGSGVSQGARPWQRLPWAASLAGAERGFPAASNGKGCAWGSAVRRQL